MISIIDYGVVNLGSILNMLRRVGAEAKKVADPEGLQGAEKIILPGVGAYDHGVSALKDRGLDEAIKRKVQVEQIPILGICLGMQLLGESSAEGTKAGLALIEGRCEKFSFQDGQALKVPHMGWNTLCYRRESPLLDSLDENARFYFVHSFHLVCSNETDVLAKSRYGIEFVSMVNRQNVWGAQFHPEKSHRFGMTLLQNFSRL